MGLSIGPVTNALAALRGAPEFGQARLRENDGLLRPREARRQDERSLFEPRRQADPNEVRAGFGEGTISPLTAALRTIDRTIQGVREHQPTIQDIREQFQARAAERRAETFRNTRGEDSGNPLQRLEPDAPQASRLVREFAATDDPERTQILAPDDANGSLAPLAANQTAETRPTSEAEAPAETRRLERPGPDDVRAERLDRVREQNRANRPRFDVRV
jgi:hypothetical protein